MGRRRRLVAAILGAAATVVVSATVAWGAPRVTFKVRPVPIEGFRHTGNIAGAGAAIETDYRISGREYGGFPPPLVGLNLYMPAGTDVHPADFPTCPPPREPEALGPQHGSRPCSAGPAGPARAFVAFGKRVRPEAATIEASYAPGGNLTLALVGHCVADSGALLAAVADEHHIAVRDGAVEVDDAALDVALDARFGVALEDVHAAHCDALLVGERALDHAALAPVLAGDDLDGVTLADVERARGTLRPPLVAKRDAALPLAETVPGEPIAISRIAVTFGTAIRVGTRTIDYLRLPKKCLRGYLPWKAELSFAGVAGLAQRTVAARYNAPCPRRP